MISKLIYKLTLKDSMHGIFKCCSRDFYSTILSEGKTQAKGLGPIGLQGGCGLRR